MPHVLGSTIKQLVELGKTPADCYRWRGAKNAEGVAQKQVGPKTETARRWMWTTLFGPVPAGLVITTTCGSKECVNPHHLKCCFQAEANRAGPTVTLLPGDVRAIRDAKKSATWATARILGEKYGVSAETIRDVWANRSWRRPQPNHGPRRSARDAAGALTASG